MEEVKKITPGNKYYKPFNIAGVLIDTPLVLAPMAGVTNRAFRLMVKNIGGCGLVNTEMFSSYAIKFRDPKTQYMIDWTDAERPVAVQVFGGDDESVSIGARVLQEAGADIVDINFGCPVPKVAKSNSGAILLKNLDACRDILAAARKVLDVPMTVKTRIGWNTNDIKVLDFVRIAEDCGADAITVHGRYAVQGYSGKADWDIIARVKETVSIPVIANGDVISCESAEKILNHTRCDGIMIGRGSLGNPWIFKQIDTYLTSGEILPQITPYERLCGAKQHAVLLRERMGERRASKEMRGHLVWYIKGMQGAPKMRARIMATQSVDEILEVLDEACRWCQSGFIPTKQQE